MTHQSQATLWDKLGLIWFLKIQKPSDATRISASRKIIGLPFSLGAEIDIAVQRPKKGDQVVDFLLGEIKRS